MRESQMLNLPFDSMKMKMDQMTIVNAMMGILKRSGRMHNARNLLFL
jgi:hypothetical protein